MLHLLQMGRFKVLTSLPFSRFRTLHSSHSWSCPPCYILASGEPRPTNTVTLSRTPIACILPLINLAHLALFLQMQLTPTTSSSHLFPFHQHRMFSLCTLTTASCSWLFFYGSCFLFPLTPSEFFNYCLTYHFELM